MGSSFEVVFTCFLTDEMPAEALDVLRWHLGLLSERPASLDEETSPTPLLCPDPHSALPGGDVAELRHQVRSSESADRMSFWGLFSRKSWPEDAMDSMMTIMELLAPYVAIDGYGGYFRQQDEAEATAFAFAAST